MMYVIFGVLGLALGSFVNALVWRLREQSVLSNKPSKKKTKKNSSSTVLAKEEGLKTKDLSILHGRSMCVHCRHRLAWFDLIPVVSWLQLQGKCQYCKKAISWQYPLVELLVAVLAVGLYLFWPLKLSGVISWALLVLWVIALVPMVALVIYDLRWREMPTVLIYALNIIGLVFVGLSAFAAGEWSAVVSSGLGALLVGGLFWIIFQVSSGTWIGGGDVRYGFTMGLLLGWQHGFFALALASYLGTALVIIFMILGKYKKKMRIPFGPFLISATYLSMLFGHHVIDWYKSLAGL